MSFYSLTSNSQLLYHYTRVDSLLEKILPTASLRMGAMAYTNDPYETKDWIFSFGTNGGSFDLPVELWSKLESDATRIAKTHAKLICFTRDNDSTPTAEIDHIWERGFCKPRMWSQYAGEHTGACLIFDREKLESSLRSTCPSDAYIFGDNVKYRNRSQAQPLRNNPFILNFDLHKSIGIDETVKLHVLHFWNQLFFEKSIDWMQEQEFRWLMWDQMHTHHIFGFSDALKAIVLGPKFPEERMKELISLQKNLNFDIRRLNWKNGVPELLSIHLGAHSFTN
jgi:hypothetical protein